MLGGRACKESESVQNIILLHCIIINDIPMPNKNKIRRKVPMQRVHIFSVLYSIFLRLHIHSALSNVLSFNVSLSICLASFILACMSSSLESIYSYPLG